MLQSVLVAWWKNHSERWGHGSVMISQNSEHPIYRLLKEWLEVAGLEKKHCNSLMMWNPWPWSWMQLGRSSSRWLLFRKHDQKGHISKRQEGTNRHEIWQMWEWKCKGHHLQLCTGRHGESWLFEQKSSEDRLFGFALTCLDTVFHVCASLEIYKELLEPVSMVLISWKKTKKA